MINKACTMAIPSQIMWGSQQKFSQKYFFHFPLTSHVKLLPQLSLDVDTAFVFLVLVALSRRYARNIYTQREDEDITQNYATSVCVG